MTTPDQILHERFGFSQFRTYQREAIEAVLNGRDVLALMPTGSGKSLCFQIPALMNEGLTVVISPLIALMKDQVDALRANGIEAAYLNSSLVIKERSHVMGLLKANRIKLLYVAPEKLFHNENEFLNFLQTLDVTIFAIDEAHCISHWGHDFRPEYLMLSKIKEHFPAIPVIALTATADELTKKDIVEKLMLKNPAIFVAGFNRENIHYYVEPKQDSFSRLLEFLETRRDESGIIYVLTRKSTETLAADLVSYGYSASCYHAGLERNIRDRNQELFIKDKVKIIVSTIAFGMGIDKSNVRFVVHIDLPKNIEAYYQETGRAGRDGLKSDALLFYSYGDVFRLRDFVTVPDNPEQTEIMLRKLDQMAAYCRIKTCRRQYLLNYFGEEFPPYCGTCDVCLDNYETFDGTIIAQKAMSAVARLEERFGISYVVDFLKGSRSAKIKEWHKGLKTFGVGADLTKEEWSRHIHYLVDIGYLKQDISEFPVLKLTPKSWPVLKGLEKVNMIKSVTREQAVIKELPYESDLFKKLKETRYELAMMEHIPPYIIFSDATLKELSTYIPMHIHELGLISGFGEYKIRKYGEQFLKEIIDYCNQMGLSSRMNLKTKAKRPAKVKDPSKPGETLLESLALFKEGKTVSQIATQRSLKESTVSEHLAHFVLSGELLVEQLVDAKKIPFIVKAAATHGTQALAPIKNDLGDAYTYSEIRAVVNYLKKNGKISG